MIRLLPRLALALGLLLSSGQVLGQQMPTTHNAFINALRDSLVRIEQTEREAYYIRGALNNAWYDRNYSDEHKDRMIAQSNKLLAQGQPFWPIVARYLAVTEPLTAPSGVEIRIPVNNYFDMVDRALANLPPDEMAGFITSVKQVLFDGEIRRDKDYAIRFAKFDGTLGFERWTNPYTLEEEEYPALSCNSVELQFLTPFDTIPLYNAHGILNLATRQFFGKGGRYTWERVELPGERVYAELGEYTLDIKENGFEADSVTFYYLDFYGEGIQGKLVDNMSGIDNPEGAEYPFFQGYGTDIVLREHMKNLDYEGGFVMRGQRRFGRGTFGDPARLTVKRPGGDTLMHVEALEFPLETDQMKKDGCAFTLFVNRGQDSLFHGAVTFIYNPNIPQVEVFKNRRNQFSNQPIVSSYHNFDMYFEYMIYNLETDSIRFQALIDQPHKQSALISQDFFNLGLFKKFRGVMPFNPIARLYLYVYGQLRREAAERAEAARIDAGATGVDESTGGYDPDDFGFFESSDFDWGPSYEESPSDDDLNFWGDDFEDPGESSSPEVDFWGDTGGGAGEDKPAGEPVDETEFDDGAEQDSLDAEPVEIWQRNFFLETMIDEMSAQDETRLPRQALSEQWHRALLQMQAGGYIFYEPTTRVFRIRPKLVLWARAARREKDYDVLQIVSQTPEPPNAVLYPDSGNIKMLGVDQLLLSDVAAVRLRPEEGIINVGKNRQLNFGGIIYGGKVNFYGQGLDKFQFDYDQFRLYLGKIDSIKFHPERDPAFDPNQNPRLTKALEQLSIRDVTGSIYLNEPNNKSGIRDVIGYPSFDCYTIAYVYWNRADIQNNQYHPDSVNFALDPFLLDSLETFDITNLAFQGQFYAADILPSFRDTLMPVSDNTYGVSEIVAEEGVPLYGGKGRFYNKIQMDYYGLWGQGRIDFLNTSAEADTFLFHLDSVMATTHQFEMLEQEIGGKPFPQMDVDTIRYIWYPREDRLALETLDKPIRMYNSSTEFQGRVYITENGVYGSGVLTAGPVEIEGDSIDLSDTQIRSKDGTFRVANERDTASFHFIAYNADVAYDVKEHVTRFTTSQPGVPLLNFPALQYESGLSEGNYNESTGEITLTTKYPEARFNQFVSTDSSQAGLKFAGTGATFNTSEEKLTVTGVDSILVADAILYPHEKRAVVDSGGKLGRFDEALMVIDTVHQAHRIENATINVASRIAYKGLGVYPYETEGVITQYLDFTSLITLPDTTTAGSSEITEGQDFLVTDRIYFRGKATLTGESPFLAFDGEVRIQSDNPLFSNSWFAFSDPAVNPDTVIVPIDSPRSNAGDLLLVGLNYRVPNRQFRTYFFQPLRDQRNERIISYANGGLTYDRRNQVFRVGPKDKLSGLNYRGTTTSYDDKLFITTVNGLYNWPYFFTAQAQQPTIQIAGSWREDGRTQEVLTQLLMRFQIPSLPKRAVDDMAAKINLWTLANQEVDWDDQVLLQAAAELLDQDSPPGEEPKTNRFLAQVQQAVLPNQIKLIDELPAELLLGNIRWQFNDSLKALYTSLPVGVIGIGEQAINRTVNAKLEFKLGRALPNGQPTTDILRIYLEADDVSWFFIEIEGNEVRTVSSEPSYNGAISEAVGKQKEGEQKLVLLDEDYKAKWVRQFAVYLLN